MASIEVSGTIQQKAETNYFLQTEDGREYPITLTAQADLKKLGDMASCVGKQVSGVLNGILTKVVKVKV